MKIRSELTKVQAELRSELTKVRVELRSELTKVWSELTKVQVELVRIDRRNAPRPTHGKTSHKQAVSSKTIIVEVNMVLRSSGF